MADTVNDDAVVTMSFDPPEGIEVDWDRWTTTMKAEYKERTGRVLTYRLRERRSSMKQLTYHGPKGMLETTLAECAEIIRNAEEAPDEVKGNRGGKGRGGSRGKGWMRPSAKWGPRPPATPPPPPHPPVVPGLWTADAFYAQSSAYMAGAMAQYQWQQQQWERERQQHQQQDQQTQSSQGES